MPFGLKIAPIQASSSFVWSRIAAPLLTGKLGAIHCKQRIRPTEVSATRDVPAWDRPMLSTRTLGSRTLDILQVAIALELDAEVFFTFDKDQATLAKRAGLAVRPRRCPPRFDRLDSSPG
jgi:hypothetical protein